MDADRVDADRVDADRVDADRVDADRHRPGRPRVVHVSWEFPPVLYGGLARHVDHLTRAQAAAGFDVTVVTAAEDVTAPRRRILPGSTERRGVRVVRRRRRPPRIPWSDVPGAAAQLDDALAGAALEEVTGHGTEERGPLLAVHGHDWIGSRAAATAARAAGVPFVITVHATEYGRRLGRVGPEHDGGLPAAVHEVECAAVAAADAVIVCSEAMRTEVCDVLGADPDRVTVVPNAVDAAAWHVRPARLRAARTHWRGDGDLLVVAAGRIEWEKGFSTLTRSLPEVLAARPGVRVVLAGRGGDERRVRALAAELGVAERIALPGWLSRGDLAALYAAADVVVVPSRYEPSGLVAREAQAAGTPVVVTAVGGLAEAVDHGRTGLTVAVGDVHGLRDAVLRLAAEPALARRLGAAGAAAVASWTWADVAKGVSAVYHRRLP